MANIITRQTAGTGATVNNAPLTNTQLDNNFINLNIELSEKLPLTGGTLTGTLNYRMLASQSTSNYDTAGDSSGFSTFYATSTATSKPTGTDHAVTTLSYSDLWQVQEAADWRTNARYIRKQENGTWSAWQRVYADDYHPNADTLTTARTISLTGDVTGSVSFNGSSNVSISATIAANSVALGTDTTGNYVAGLTAGTGITITGTAGEGWSPTVTVDGTSINTASKVVIRDASGNFSAGTITAALSGNATTATTWQTARTITLGGDLTGNVSINGSADVTLTAAVIDNSHNHTSLTGVTSIAFAAQSTDIASITTTIGTTETFFDFNLTDDNNNDYWRWRFTPSGSTVYDAMVLKPVANGVADLTVSGSIITPDDTPLIFTNPGLPTIDNTANSTSVGFRIRKAGSSNSASSTYGVLQLARTNHDNTSTSDGSTLYFVLKDDTGTEREYAGIGGQKTVAGASGGQLNFYNYNRNQLGYWNASNLFLNTQIAFNDVSRYWLSTATNWGIYWDTTDNRIEFHGAGVDRWAVDLDNGSSAQAGTITADSAEFTGLGTNGDPGTDDLYIGGYGIQGSRVSPVYVHNHSTGGVRISSGSTLGTANGILVEANQTTVTGLLTATSKSFTIPHPTKPGKKLRYGSLEGPEHGVYVRGKVKGNVIELPEYWTKLVNPDSITVQLTAIGKGQKLYVEEVVDNKVYIANNGMFASEPYCFYLVQAERVDIEKMQVEIE